MEKTNQERAQELFEKEPSATAAYFTKDGNMFRVERYAKDWAKGSNGGEVETILRTNPVAGKPKKEKEADTEKQTDGGDTKTSEAELKAELTQRYIELFDTKPNHLTGIKKLQEQIAAKEAEIAEANK